MWKSLLTLEPDKADELLVNDAQLSVWMEMFKFYCMIESSPGRRALSAFPEWYPDIERTWKEECHAWLPYPLYAKLRGRLLQIEDIYGDAMRERFPL